MDAYLITVFSAVATGLCGIFIGWKLQDRRYQKLVSQLQVQSGDQSLKLLETRKHLRTISSHLKTNLSKDQTIRQLKRKQKSLLKRIDHQTLQATRKEKAHYIETAKIKLELIEIKLSQSVSKGSAASAGPVNGSGFDADLSKDFSHLNGDLQKLLKHAGVKKVHQLAALSRRDIDRLASQHESIPAE